MDGMKKCGRCRRWLDLNKFAPDPSRSDGVRGWCRSCQGARDHERRLSRYGLTVRQFNRMVKEQNGKCAICNKEAPLSIDHNHKCCPAKAMSCGGCVRGLLCSRCNTAIGSMEDDPEILMAAVDYLRMNEHGRLRRLRKSV